MFKFFKAFRPTNFVHKCLADYWSGHHRSFLGITVHWIDENSFKRRHTVLCYKELSGAHTFDVLADTMQQFHRAFDIESKIILAINILFCVLFSLFLLCVYAISMLCDRGHIRNVFIFRKCNAVL